MEKYLKIHILTIKTDQQQKSHGWIQFGDKNPIGQSMHENRCNSIPIEAKRTSTKSNKTGFSPSIVAERANSPTEERREKAYMIGTQTSDGEKDGLAEMVKMVGTLMEN